LSGNLHSVIAFLGLGSNLGDAAGYCRQAIDEISRRPGNRVLRVSSLYRTEPLGVKEQDWFVNAVIEIRTTLSPRDLLRALQGIEKSMGRVRDNVPRWGPRAIDIDILLYGQDVVEEEGLCIPHPEMHRRRFVLVPMEELASYVIHPKFGVTIKGLLQRLEDPSEVVRL
jgi:2-amino-4-hydroxy-6-hydroxymethyldihydropteridine diphosphokinase